MAASRMYNFILNMWVQKSIDEAKVRAYVPTYITASEADAILATPQNA